MVPRPTLLEPHQAARSDRHSRRNWHAFIALPLFAAVGCGSSTVHTATTVAKTAIAVATTAPSTTSAAATTSAATTTAATTQAPTTGSVQAGVPADFFARIAPTAEDLGPSYVYLFDPMGAEQDTFDKSLQDGLPACKNTKLLMPYLVPVSRAKAVQGWFFANTASEQGAAGVAEVLVMNTETEAKALMTQVREAVDFPNCLAAWTAEVSAVNATADGPLKGHAVRFLNTNPRVGAPLSELGDDQVTTTWQTEMSVDGVTSAPSQAARHTARFGSVIVMYDDAPVAQADRVATVLAAKVRAALK